MHVRQITECFLICTVYLLYNKVRQSMPCCMAGTTIYFAMTLPQPHATPADHLPALDPKSGISCTQYLQPLSHEGLHAPLVYCGDTPPFTPDTCCFHASRDPPYQTLVPQHKKCAEYPTHSVTGRNTV